MATYLDETVPADSEAVTLGASRIRQLKVNIDAALDQIFGNTGTLPSAGGSPPTFLPGWITTGGALGGASLFTPGSIQTPDIAAGAITTALIAPSAVTDEQIASGTISGDKLVSGFIAPTASVATSSIQNLAVGTNQIALASITSALMASGLIKGAAIGSYAGSNTVSANVTSLSFAPTVIILLPGRLIHGFGISFLSEVSSGTSPVHASWVIGAITGAFATAVEWSSNGFTIVPSNFDLNLAGQAHTYLALAV